MTIYIYTTKTFITIPSTGATPKLLHAIKSGRQRALTPCDQIRKATRTHSMRSNQEGNAHSLHAIKSGRQRALASCDQLNPHNSRSKSGKQKINSP